LVGCGHMGKYHAAKLSAHPDVRFVGCYDIDPRRSEEIASRHRTKSFSSLELLAAEIEAAVVAVPTIEHDACSIPLLRRGIAVLIEKPLAVNSARAREIDRAAAASGAVLQVGHSERFSPVYRAARSRINRPGFVETHRLAPFKGRGHDVSVIYDLMIHDIDLLLDLTGSRPLDIQAAGVAVITETFDIVNARLTFPDNCVANVTASRISFKEMRKLRVFQKSGYISMDLASRELESYVLVDKNSEKANENPSFLKFNLGDNNVIIRENIDIPPGDNLEMELDSFVKAVSGLHAPLVGGQSGLAALEVAEEIENRCRQYQRNL